MPKSGAKYFTKYFTVFYNYPHTHIYKPWMSYYARLWFLGFNFSLDDTPAFGHAGLIAEEGTFILL